MWVWKLYYYVAGNEYIEVIREKDAEKNFCERQELMEQ